MKSQIRHFLAVETPRMLEMTSYLNNGYDVMKCFAAHNIIIPSLYLSKSKTRARPGCFCAPPI